ncbi:MAG: AI-2E family transporter [Verrucomicrobiota bacterium]
MQALNRKLLPLISLVTGLLVVIIFYYGRPVLMPLALAGLFAFMLNPIVNFLHRRKIPRTAAVVLVTVCVFSLIGGLGWILGREFRALAEDLPKYRHNIQHRVEAVRGAGKDGVVGRLTEMKEAIDNATSKKDDSVEKGVPRPMPVVIKNDETASNNFLGGTFMDSAGSILGTLATVIVFVIFILLRQQELRNRVMRLVGFRNLTLTTRAMDEVGGRVGRYLLMQGLINGIYGVLLAAALYFIGMPYVVLWGVMAALFRFIPYLGPLLAAVLPGLLSLAVFDDWTHPVMVISVIIGLELLTNMVLEPVLYGQSVGVSDFALLVAIAFWTWMWGGIGLVMATPLTVCLVVIAKHIPQLEWVDILMGDKPDVRPYMIYFQRLVAEDEAEAEEFIAGQLKEKSPMAVADETMLPAIALAKRESRYDRITEAEEARIHEVSRRMMAQVTASQNEDLIKAADTRPVPEENAPLVLGRALDGMADQNALELFDTLLPGGLKFDIVPAQRLNSEFFREVEERQPAAILLSATPPGSQEAVRLHLRKLKASYPKVKVCIGRWGVPDDVANPEGLIEAGATAVFTTFAQAEKAFTDWFGGKHSNASVLHPPAGSEKSKAPKPKTPADEPVNGFQKLAAGEAPEPEQPAVFPKMPALKPVEK